MLVVLTVVLDIDMLCFESDLFFKIKCRATAARGNVKKIEIKIALIILTVGRPKMILIKTKIIGEHPKRASSTPVPLSFFKLIIE